MRQFGHVSVHALDGGYLTLPEKFFVAPIEDLSARKTVPSLSFLIQHRNITSLGVTRIVFDLGIRRRLEEYAEPIYYHTLTRQPISGEPGCVAALDKGALKPSDIDFVIFSHLHWDHIGDPSNFPSSTYVIGPGSLNLIKGNSPGVQGSHNHFESGILELERTIELIGPSKPKSGIFKQVADGIPSFSRPWVRMGLFEAAMDIFGDGSLYIVLAPGHLIGHINLLCRLESGKYVYLAGDSYHDPSLLSGEKDIATWTDPARLGTTCCIHQDRAMAAATIEVIRRTMQGDTELGQIEVVSAHDRDWDRAARSQNRHFPGQL